MQPLISLYSSSNYSSGTVEKDIGSDTGIQFSGYGEPGMAGFDYEIEKKTTRTRSPE